MRFWLIHAKAPKGATLPCGFNLVKTSILLKTQYGRHKQDMKWYPGSQGYAVFRSVKLLKCISKLGRHSPVRVIKRSIGSQGYRKTTDWYNQQLYQCGNGVPPLLLHSSEIWEGIILPWFSEWLLENRGGLKRMELHWCGVSLEFSHVFLEKKVRTNLPSIQL